MKEEKLALSHSIQLARIMKKLKELEKRMMYLENELEKIRRVIHV